MKPLFRVCDQLSHMVSTLPLPDEAQLLKQFSFKTEIIECLQSFWISLRRHL